MRTQERLAGPRPIAFEALAGATPAHPSLRYRPALDGLRALAVLAVFAYHLGFGWMPGGFLGVDVFFVLSGFLITTLLLKEYGETGGIALWRFWGRRARRLLPALFLVVVATMLWVRFTAATFELPQARGDLLWAMFYGSNWNLVATAQDYFAQYGSASLVRHTWSLAIEEQFYLLWPLVVLAALRVAKGSTRALVATCAAGIVVSVTLMARLAEGADPSRSYYGTETRAHQLLIGALLAILLARVPAGRARRSVGRAATVIGVGALLVAFLGFTDSNATYYRGVSAAVAIAAALLIWGLEVAPKGAVGRTLSMRPATWIGKVSYGIYLWHWPVILAVDVPLAVLAWMPNDLGLAASRVLLTFLIAGLSYRLVERPIREGTLPFVRGSLPRFAVATGFVTFALVVGIVSLTDTPEERSFVRGGHLVDAEGCELEICVRYLASGPDAPVVAVVGDSIARSMDPGLVPLARRQGWTYVLAASDGCRVTHLLTSTDGDTTKYEPCFETTPGLWHELVTGWDPDLVLVIGDMELADLVDASGIVRTAADPAHVEAERVELEAVATTFLASGARLAFVAPQPAVLPDECLRLDTGDFDVCAVPASSDGRVARFTETLADVVSIFPQRAFLVSVSDRVCPDGICTPTVDGIFPRYDGHHYSVTGARWIVPHLHEELLEAGALPASMRG